MQLAGLLTGKAKVAYANLSAWRAQTTIRPSDKQSCDVTKKTRRLIVSSLDRIGRRRLGGRSEVLVADSTRPARFPARSKGRLSPKLRWYQQRPEDAGQASSRSVSRIKFWTHRRCKGNTAHGALCAIIRHPFLQLYNTCIQIFVN